MSDIWQGNFLKIAIFGESHGPAIGAVIDGLPAGLPVDLERISHELRRRAPGKNVLSTARQEDDEVKILSGVYNGFTTGNAVTGMISNRNIRSSDYEKMRDVMRPGHADYPGRVKYHGFNDYRGGGHFSGRLTAPLVFTGAIAKTVLEAHGICVTSHIKSIADIEDAPIDPLSPYCDVLKMAAGKEFPVIDDKISRLMQEKIKAAKENGDSVGGIIECLTSGVPAGLGEPFFGSVESSLSHLLFSIPAVKAVAFGKGFALTKMTGSNANDAYFYRNGRILTTTNNNGGILGGITNGMPILITVGIKPTPSISKQQKTINLSTQEETTLSISGRHDPCIVPRAVPVIEAVCALGVLDLYLCASIGE